MVICRLRNNISFPHPIKGTFVFLSPCTTLLSEDRRRLEIKNKRVYFVLLSPCTTLLREDKRRLGNKKEFDSFCISLALHYLCTKLKKDEGICNI